MLVAERRPTSGWLERRGVARITTHLSFTTLVRNGVSTNWGVEARASHLAHNHGEGPEGLETGEVLLHPPLGVLGRRRRGWGSLGSLVC